MKAITLSVLLALFVGACALGQPTRQMTEQVWDIVVTVFAKDGSTSQYRYTKDGGDIHDCMSTAREYGDKVRTEDNTVSILCLSPASSPNQEQHT